MGLLDDAIREHLELKRLRGADPGLVAREEHEAFGPMHHGGAPGDVDDDTNVHGGLEEPAGEELEWIDDDHGPAAASHADGAHEDDHVDHDRAEGVQDFSSVGQETAELDMRAVLAEDPDLGHGPVDGHVPVEAHASDPRADTLDDAHESAYDIPGQEQLFERRPTRGGFDEE